MPGPKSKWQIVLCLLAAMAMLALAAAIDIAPSAEITFSCEIDLGRLRMDFSLQAATFISQLWRLLANLL